MPNIGGVEYPYTPEGLAAAQQTGQLSYAEMLAQVSALDPNWQYNEQLVTLMDNAFRQQFAPQQPALTTQGQVTPTNTVSPPLTGTQMPTSRLQDQEMTAAIMSQRGEMPAWMADMQRAEARQRAPQQMPATAATAIGGLDPARQPHTGVPGIPTATPGVGGGRTQSTSYQPRDSRDYRAMQQPITRQPGMMTPSSGNPYAAQRRQPGMGQPLQQRPIQQQAPRSGSGTGTGHVGAGSRNIGGSQMPNTGQQTYSGYSQRPTGTPVAGQQQAKAAQSKYQQMYQQPRYGGYGP